MRGRHRWVDTQAPSILNWAVGVGANEEVDDVDEDPSPEDEEDVYSPIHARCPASSLERSKAKGTAIPLGIGNVEPTTDFGDVYTEDVVDTEHEDKAECCMLG